MTTTNADQQITLADVARLASVQRPVVSMWRTRSKRSVTPFPTAVGISKGLETFNAREVVNWLQTTGRGNNPNAGDDVGAFTFAATFDVDDPLTVHGCTALLTLRELLGQPLAGMTELELLDAADDIDPDDVFMFSEIQELGSAGKLTGAASYCDELVHAAYNTRAAFGKLIGERARLNLREQALTSLSEPALQLLASAAVGLRGAEGDAVVVDPFASAGEILLGVTAQVDEAQAIAILMPYLDDPSVRLTQRRLRLHGALPERLAVGTLELPPDAVTIAQFPSERAPTTSTVEILEKIALIVDAMDDSHRALVVAPSSALSEPLRDRGEERLRANLLRSGRVRAAVTLPRGLVPNKPRQSHTLWVLGQGHHAVPLAERWTVVADLTGRILDDVVAQDLVGDLAAAIGTRRDVLAHSFRFARFVPTRSLLTTHGALTDAANRPRGSAGDSAATLARIDTLTGELPDDSRQELSIRAAPRNGNKALPPVLVSDALASRHLRYFPGSRIRLDHFSGTIGVPLVGAPEVFGERAAGSRRIDQLELAATYPTARRTEPGDVVFCTSPRPAAMVDEEGGAVVVFPARVLRVDSGDPGGLVPELVAHAVRSGTGTDWRRRAVRRVSDAQREHVRTVLGRLEQEKRLVRDRLARLEELSALVLETDGIEFMDTEANGR